MKKYLSSFLENIFKKGEILCFVTLLGYGFLADKKLHKELFSL